MSDKVSMKSNSVGDEGLLISIVSPCYNEQEAIGYFYEELKKVLDGLDGFRHEIIFVDDGSTDGTLEKLNSFSENDPTIKVYSL